MGEVVTNRVTLPRRPDSAKPKRYPKDVMLFLYDPKKKFVHVIVELHNRPGALADAASRVAGLDLNVLTGFTSVGLGTDEGIWSFFAECGNKATTPEAVKKEIEESKSVKGVQVAASVDGLLTEGLHFPMRMTPGRVAMAFNPSSLVSMFERLGAIFGSGASLIIFEEGESVGRTGAMFVKSIVGEDVEKKRIHLIGDLLSGWGWGLVNSMDIDDSFSTVRVRIEDCFEAQGRASGPRCHFMRGMLVGFFEEVSGNALTGTEVSCATQGNPYCEFSITRK